MDVLLLLLCYLVLPEWLEWLRQHFELLLWFLAPAQVVCIFAMATALELPRIPKWVRPNLLPFFKLAEIIYGLGFVLAIAMLLWDYLFLPQNPLGYAWSLSVALFGTMVAVGRAQEERFGEMAWWRKLPIWGFIFFAVFMTLARPWSWDVRLLALAISYLPVRLSLSWGVDICLWDLLGAACTWMVLARI